MVRRMLALPLVAAFLLAGCAGATSSGYSCRNGTCKLSLHGAGADSDMADALGPGTTVRLESSDADSAKISIGGESATLAKGAEQEVAGHAVTLTKGGKDDVDLRIVG